MASWACSTFTVHRTTGPVSAWAWSSEFTPGCIAHRRYRPGRVARGGDQCNARPATGELRLGAVRDADLKRLRRRVAQVLDEVQRLPGFAERLEKVQDVPDFARAWSWDAVVNATESDDWRPGVVRWVPDSARPDLSDVADRLPATAEGEVLVPVDEPLPHDRDRAVLSSYRAAVAEFARRFLFNAEWSPRAVHDALRLQQRIRLPDRPEPWVAVPLDAPFTLDPACALPQSWLIELGEALLAAAEAATGSDASGEKATDGRASRPLPGEDQWQGAVEAIKLRLQGLPVLATDRSRATRLRPWLNAAVNGALDAKPLFRADDATYPKRRRKARRRSQKSGR